jgi:hypothetical protein
MSLLRDKSKKQMEELNRTIKKSGGDIQDRVRKSEKTKENKIPNAYYMDNPFDSNRKDAIDTWEHWSKNGAHHKSVAMKSRDPKNKPTSMYTKFENFNSLNEGSHSDFLMNYGPEIKNALTKLRKISKIYNDITEEQFNRISHRMDKYDINVGEQIDNWSYGDADADKIANFAISNQDRFGTEAQIILQAIDEYADVLNISINESSDEDKYLSSKQKKLPDGLKKGIIKKMKKSGKTVGDDKEDNKDSKDTKDDKKDDKDSKDSKDSKDDKKDSKDDKKDDSSKSDEDKYLSAKQKKLPDGLKKGIIARAKKSKKKVNESKINEFKKTKIDADGIQNGKFPQPNKLNNLKHFHEITYDGDTTQDGDLNDDSWVKGTEEDKLRPMFKNLPDNTIRPNYDVLRTGKSFTMDGIQGIIVGIKNGELLLDVVNKDTDKHETIKYDMKKVIKELKKNNKEEKIEEKRFFDRFKKEKETTTKHPYGWEPGDEPTPWDKGYPKMYAPKKELKFPILYGFITKELKERKSGGPIAIFQDGYIFKCDTPQKLKFYEEKFKSGNTYNRETITYTGTMQASHHTS